jgi:hypothetical protein
MARGAVTAGARHAWTALLLVLFVEILGHMNETSLLFVEGERRCPVYSNPIILSLLNPIAFYASSPVLLLMRSV